MPSPRWSSPDQVPIAQAITVAIHAAWEGDERSATKRFTDTLRKLLGPDVFTQVEIAAYGILRLQPRPPEGFRRPPDWAWFEICPRCQLLRATEYTRAQNGRVELEVLRDKDWLFDQFDRGRTCGAIAKSLRCSPSLVVDWAAKHGLQPPKTLAAVELDAAVKHRHYEGEAPGTIARALETTVSNVRASLSRQKIANQKAGHHYFDREWWRVRLEDRRMTIRACAKEAGIKPHNGTWWVQRFALREVAKKNRGPTGRPPKYPQLHDAGLLRELLERHDSYQSVSAELGCAPSLVSRAARDLLGAEKRSYPNQLPHSRRSWWTERIDAGATTYELAEETGILEKSVREKLRVLDLLAAGYRNNTARERQARKGAAA